MSRAELLFAAERQPLFRHALLLLLCACPDLLFAELYFLRHGYEVFTSATTLPDFAAMPAFFCPVIAVLLEAIIHAAKRRAAPHTLFSPPSFIRTCGRSAGTEQAAMPILRPYRQFVVSALRDADGEEIISQRMIRRPPEFSSVAIIRPDCCCHACLPAATSFRCYRFFIFVCQVCLRLHETSTMITFRLNAIEILTS